MPKRVADSSDDDSDDGEDVPLAARMSGGRRSASKKASYAEKENSDSDDDDEDGSPGGGDDDSNVAPTDEDEGGGDSSDAEEEEEDDDDEYKGSHSDEPPPPKKAKAAAASSSSKKSPASKAAAPKSAAVLYVKKALHGGDLAPAVFPQPTVVDSWGDSYVDRFEWDGTRDRSPFLSPMHKRDEARAETQHFIEAAGEKHVEELERLRKELTGTVEEQAAARAESERLKRIEQMAKKAGARVKKVRRVKK